MMTTNDAQTLYLHVAQQLGGGDAPAWDNLTRATQAKYRRAVKALAKIDEPIDRAAALHEAIGHLWNAPVWSEMHGPERAAYLFAAGSRLLA
jgi:hypothetical protein